MLLFESIFNVKFFNVLVQEKPRQQILTPGMTWVTKKIENKNYASMLQVFLFCGCQVEWWNELLPLLIDDC